MPKRVATGGVSADSGTRGGRGQVDPMERTTAPKTLGKALAAGTMVRRTGPNRVAVTRVRVVTECRRVTLRQPAS